MFCFFFYLCTQLQDLQCTNDRVCAPDSPLRLDLLLSLFFSSTLRPFIKNHENHKKKKRKTNLHISSNNHKQIHHRFD